MNDRLPIGSVVRTLDDDGSDDWSDDARAQRGRVPRGAEGYVREISTGHGLCYLVDHIELGVRAWYNHGELADLLDPPEDPR